MLIGTMVAWLTSSNSGGVDGTSADNLLAAMSNDATMSSAAAGGKKIKKQQEHQHDKSFLTPEAAAAVGTTAISNATQHYSNTQRFFAQQVDHFDDSNTDTWPHRYYAKKDHWKGPGHPIFLMIGGEGSNDVGFFYAFIEKVMAKKFGAFAIHPEHRWYGPYKPIQGNFTAQDLVRLLTPEQAMMDMIQVRHWLDDESIGFCCGWIGTNDSFFCCKIFSDRSTLP